MGQGVSVLDSFRERPEIQVAAAYLGGAWLFYDVAELVVFVLELPDLVLRLLLGLLAAGAILALLTGRWLRLTLRELRRGRREPDEDIGGVPDFLEPILLRAAGAVSGRTTLVATGLSTVAFILLFLALWTSWAEAHVRQVPDDPRITVAVFPFGQAGSAGIAPSAGAREGTAETTGLGAGLADLLSSTIDGTPGLRVVDPASFWPSLEAGATGGPAAPGADEARRISRELGADHFVFGDLLPSGSRLEIAARVEEVDTTREAKEPVLIRLSAHEDSLGPALDHLAVQVVAAVWDRDQLPTVPDIDRSATRSATALRAYLEAKGAMRQGRLPEALEAVERAVDLDSTFALAHLEHFNIESWIQFERGQPLSGLRPILDRAGRHAERLTPRNRMRIDAHRALDETDGVTAAFLFERILATDSLDVDALEGLAFAYLTQGWQLGRDPDDVDQAHRRVIRADSANLEAMATLARLAMGRDDPGEAGRWVSRLVRADSAGRYARGALGSYQIVTAGSEAVDSLLAAWAQAEVGTVLTVLRDLRTHRPDLAERYINELTADSMPTYHQRAGEGSRAQLWMARGRLSGVDSLLAAGGLESLRVVLAGYQVAAALAGVGEADAEAVGELAAYTPLDSLEALMETREVWITAWAVGAYHASFGDIAEARRWQEAIAALPPGQTTVSEWPAALAADLEARLAVRRGDMATAERWATTAYELWTVHTFTALEHYPEPAIRFHLAELRRARGASDSALSLYRSLCPPYTWLGFYTARSSLEAAKLLEAGGQRDQARHHYEMAARFWEGGDDAVVGELLGEARAGLERLASG